MSKADRRPGWSIWLIVAVVMIGGSLTAGPKLSAVAQSALIVAALGVAFQLVFGLLGELSLGHSALFGIGAYTFAALGVRDVHLGVAVVAAVVVGLVAGVLVAGVTIRMEGVYFAVVTFSLAMIAHVVVAATRGLGRDEGIVGVPSLPELSWLSRGQFQVVLLAATFFALLVVMIRLRRSRFGAMLELVRADRALALAQGINVGMIRVVVTGLSGALAGLVGAMFAQNARFVSPTTFLLYYILTPLAVVLVGGVRHNFGVVPGTIVIVVVPRLLDLEPVTNQVLSSVLLVVAVLAVPGGIAEGGERLGRAIRARWSAGTRRSSSETTATLKEEVT